ncbi:MAG TPA: hypothetical protein VGD17_01575 [Chitinophagaceae bacterium]
MKLGIFITLFLLFAVVSGCYKDVISPGSDPNGPPQNVSFSGDLVPLFSSNCGSAGCHDAVPNHKPSLVPEKAYSALISGGYVNTAVPSSSAIYLVVKSGEMPPSGGLKSSDAQKILDWIRNGAPNN